ncbi:MAG TPA: LuxR C-terminal-related transcriptional regulator [Acidimicrobiales bacterium]|jgi:DNA-binding CsgD family transcriptional regulator|nr:LuxR C-terminal-related transcriptional regulator [Acidimicrobiales bacterium]
MIGPWPLVGRSHELEFFGDVLAGGERSAVVLTGRAGVGKTRLALECLAIAETRGMATAFVRATAAARSLPLGALAPVLPSVEGPGLEPTDMLRRAMDAVVALGRGRPLLLVVDDAHLLDDASAALVHYMAASRSAFVVATVRADSRPPEAVVALWKDELAERVEVPPLDPAGIEAVLVGALGGPVSAATLHQLSERSAGNALYLRELVRAGLESGGLRGDDGIWRLSGPPPVSSRLAELVESRLGMVDDRQRLVLEALAFGERLGVRCLLTVADEKQLDDLEERGLIVTAYDGRRLEATLGHPLYGDVIRARIPARRAEAVLKSLANRVQAVGARRREDALRFATWRLEVGGDMPPELMIAAARTARSRWDLALAERLAHAAVDAGGGFDAALLGAEVALLQGRGEEVEAQLAALMTTAADDRQRVQVVSARVDNFIRALGRTEDALRVAEEAEALVTDPAVCDELAGKRAYALHMGGRRGEALEVLEPVLARGGGPELAMAWYTGGACLARSGRFAEAVRVSRKCLPADDPTTGPLPYRPSLHDIVRATALAGAGELEEAEALAAADFAQAVTGGSVTVQAVAAIVVARVQLARGDVAAAAAHAREARDLFRQRPFRTLVHTALIYLAMAEALGGSADGARAALDELDRMGMPTGDINAIELRRARAWAELAAGNRAAAHTHLQEAAALARYRGDVVWESDVVHDLARLGWAPEAVDRLQELAGIIEGDMAPARAAHAAALVSGDPAALADVSAAFEAMGARLLAAEAAASAAVALRRKGDLRRAAAAEQRAATLARACHGAITPALRAIETQAVLSSREIEVAALAAAGQPNREIAGRLSVSVRTVENHLQRVYEKLGVARRADLGQALGPV